MKKCLFPALAAYHAFEIVNGDQIQRLEILKHVWRKVPQVIERQIQRSGAAIARLQTGGLKQMGAPAAGGAPQIDELLAAVIELMAQMGDKACIGTGPEAGKRGVITHTNT